jgi:hypothetical protein
MSEQDESSILAIEETPEPPMVPDQPFAGLKLPSAVHAIAWSTGAAALTWLATCLGQTYLEGRYSALGLDALSLPPIGQRDILVGIGIILQSAIDAIIALIVARLVYLLLRWGTRRVKPQFHLSFPTFVRQRLWWIVLLLVFADAAFFFNGMRELQKQGNGILLKSTTEVGSAWTQIVFDTDAETVWDLDLLYGAGFALFVGMSWWIITKGFKRPWSRIAFSLYAVTGTLAFMFGFAYLHGMADTVHDFPVVTFSGMAESDRGYIPFLLGEDDKMFALLIIKLDDKMEVSSRYVVYLPRTEVKWMTVLQYRPIYRFANINDLVRLAQQVKNSSK